MDSRTTVVLILGMIILATILWMQAHNDITADLRDNLRAVKYRVEKMEAEQSQIRKYLNNLSARLILAERKEKENE